MPSSGPAMYWPKSITRTPVSAPLIELLLVLGKTLAIDGWRGDSRPRTRLRLAPCTRGVDRSPHCGEREALINTGFVISRPQSPTVSKTSHRSLGAPPPIAPSPRRRGVGGEVGPVMSPSPPAGGHS